MHDQRVRVKCLDAGGQAVLAVRATGGDGEQAGRFVDDEEVIVEVEDGGHGDRAHRRTGDCMVKQAARRGKLAAGAPPMGEARRGLL